MKPQDLFTPKAYTSAERVTGVPAQALLIQAGLTSSDGSIVHSTTKRTILDNACGTGIVTSLLFRPESKSENLEVLCGDVAEPMIEGVKQKIAEKGWNATTQVVDSQAMTLPDDKFDFVLTNFGLQAMPKSSLALAEMVRVAAPKGTIGFTTWEHVPWLPMVHSALLTLTFATPPPPIPARVFGLNDEFNAEWDSADYIRASLASNSSLDPNSIHIEKFSFDLDIGSDEDKDTFSAMAVMMARVITTSLKWTEEQIQTYMADDKLLKALRGTMGNGVDKVKWVAWVTTAQKLGVPA